MEEHYATLFVYLIHLLVDYLCYGLVHADFHFLLVYLLCKYEVSINFYILLSEPVMIVCIHWQVGGVLNHLNNDPLNSHSCVFAIILITFLWVANSLFPSVESP